MNSFKMNNNTISDKIKLRNEYANKIINKFKKSINLLSEINSHILKKQKGGTLDNFNTLDLKAKPTDVKTLLNEINTEIDKNGDTLTNLITNTVQFKENLKYIMKTTKDANLAKITALKKSLSEAYKQNKKI